MADLLWKECLRWLLDANLLPVNHRILWQETQLLDLAQVLRNGVILCQMMANLCPDSIDLRDVCLRPQMSQFLCLKNIRLFLHACLTHLHLPPSDLFEPQMLFDCSDFGRVLHTLSLVSHSKPALNASLKPFPGILTANRIEFMFWITSTNHQQLLKTEKLEQNRSADYYNEDLYRNLEELTLEASRSAAHSVTTNGRTTNEPNPMVLLEFPINGSGHDASVGTSCTTMSSNGSNRSSTSDSSHRSNGSDGSGCSSRPSSRRTHEEDIYEDLCYVSLRTVTSGGTTTSTGTSFGGASNSGGSATLTSSTSSPNHFHTISSTSTMPSKASLALEKRDYCLKELLETERNYVEALHMIQSYFVRPLKCCMRPDDRSIVFGQLGQLAELHRTFLDELTEACKASGDTVQQQISACFIRWKDRFVLYGDYCANLPNAQALLDQLCAKNEFLNTKILQYQVRWYGILVENYCNFCKIYYNLDGLPDSISVQKQANGGKFKLRDLLSVPVQRVLKYHLLLHELLRQTPDTAPEDQSALRTAYEHMIDLGQFINEVKRDAETLQIIGDIERSITDLEMPEQTQLQDYGRLVRDGELKVRSYDNHHKLRARYVFVFDKVLLMCKAMRNDQYSYRQALILLDYELCDQLPTALVSVMSNGMSGAVLPPSAGSNAFFLMHQLQHHVFTFFAKNEEQKLHWMSSIRTAMDNTSPAAPVVITPNVTSSYDANACVHSYIMITVDNPAHCDHCGRLLKGKFFQGYRCVQCALKVHKHCIPNTGRCGLPPQLPPRRAGHLSPPCASVQPTGIRITQCPLPPLPPLPAPPIPPGNESPVHSREVTYENIRLEGQPWFAGQMDRGTAQQMLRSLPHGTFLVRVSCKQRGSYALSLNDSGEVKHMRIVVTDGGRFYLSQSKCFDSIWQLIRWYEQHSLAESFVGLDITLGRPFRLVSTSALTTSSTSPPCISSPDSNGSGLHDFTSRSYSGVSPSPSNAISAMPTRSDSSCQTTDTSPPPTHSASGLDITSPESLPALSMARALYRFTGETLSLLSFQKGDLIQVLSKAGERKGWWKGRVDNRIGYFPYKYVTELNDTWYICFIYFNFKLSVDSPDWSCQSIAIEKLADFHCKTLHPPSFVDNLNLLSIKPKTFIRFYLLFVTITKNILFFFVMVMCTCCFN